LKVTDISDKNVYLGSQWHEDIFHGSSKKSGLDLDSFHTGQPQQPRPLKEVPCHMDKTHFNTALSCAMLFSSLSPILTKLHVDFEIQHIKNKIKGVWHPENIPCSFVVNVFRATENNVVEFQRRSGCVVQFSKFYSEVLLAMNMNSTASQQAEKYAKEEPPANLDEATIKNLIRMASSELVDVQREGLRVLANCLSSESNKKLLLSTSSTFLTAILSSADPEVLRLGSVLSEAVSSNSSRATIPIAESSFALLSRGDFSSLLGRDTKRHIIKAIAGFTQSHYKHFAQHPNNHELISCLERCAVSADSATRVAVAAALDRLVVF